MKEIVRYGFILSLICIIAALSLSVVNSATKPRIIAQAKIEEEASLRQVLPDAVRFEPEKKEEETLYYKAYDSEDKFIGVAFKAQGKGYSSVIETMVGMIPDGTITAIKILAQNETPGMGTRIQEPSFIQQFTQKNIKDLSGVQAITSATISSKAVIDSVKKKAKEIRELING